ncbi:MAG: T9SS type A sorting domain-containing protein [Ignavibacteriales bacterium]|nr:T9SS type A sorting domain-containing protein [Ignavibacteriales bacterium]
MQSFNANIVGGVTVPMGYQFSVRIYPYSPVGSSPMNPSFAIHNNVQICGESNPYVPPTSTCVTWNLISSQAVSSISGSITATPEVLGLGTSAPFMSVFLPYVANGQRLWVGNAGWPASNRDHNRYIEFTVSPTPGNNLTVNTVSFLYGDNPASTNFNILQGEVYYTVNNWSNTFQLGTTFTYLNTGMTGVNLTIPGGVVVPNGQTFKMRIYPWSAVGSNPMNPSFATHKNVTICGTTDTVPPPTGSICGTKFNDLNGNGLMDLNEPGLPGWQIGLGIATVPYAVTDVNGDYCFTGLPAGNYTVSEVQQPGWVQTYPAAPGTHSVTLTNGQHLENVNFGNMLATLNCDSLSATAVRTNPDDCNWTLSLNQPANLPGIASVQVVCLLPNQFTTGTGLGTNYQNWFSSGNNIFTPPTGLVPGGDLNNFFNMSLLYVTTPQLVVVNWIDTLGNIACSDTVELDCQISCTTIIEDTVTCNDGNPILKFRFRNDADFNMSNIQYTVVSPSGVTVNPSNVTLTTPVLPGQISGLQSVLISGASVGDTVELSVKFTSSDGCCWCYGKITVIIPDCYTFCDSLGVSAVGNPKNCSYDISLVNNSTMVFTSVQFELISGGVFSNFTASSTGWGFTNVWPNNSITLVKMPISTGIGTGTYNSILNMSISQYTNSIQTVVVRWIKNGVVMCTDTLRFTCIPTVPPEDDCSQLIDQTITCRADGSFMFKFRVQNNSSIISTGYGINPTTPGVTFSKTLVNNVSILPGQVSPFDSLIVTGIAPNTSLCFQTAIFTTVTPGDTVYNFCCHSDTLCITTPDCGASDIKDTEIPKEFELLQNYPNPFNPSTTISYTLPRAGSVKLSVYDPLGREVAVLVDEYKNVGRYTVVFDATMLNSGIYFYRIVSGEYNQTRKLILLK